MALKRKGLKKAYAILILVISDLEWKWPSSGELENNHENETVLPVVSDNDFDSDSSYI